MGHVSNTDTNFAFYYNDVPKGYLASANPNKLLNFTGQHRCTVRDVPQSDLDDLVGLIVSADRSEYVRMSGGIARGADAITINEALPIVSVSKMSEDPKVFGVVSAAEDPENRQDEYGAFVTPFPKDVGDTRAYINSVGEGAVWVTDLMGDSSSGMLRSGDYITTTAIAPGYGVRQTNDVLHSYTVAKITMDCDFDPPQIPKYRIKKRMVTKRVPVTRIEIRESSETVFDEETQRYVKKKVEVEERIEETEDLPVYDAETGEDTGETIKVPKMEEKETEENDLDELGNLQWEPVVPEESEAAYRVRYLRISPSGPAEIITKAEYDAEPDRATVCRAAFVGCTYHCG